MSNETARAPKRRLRPFLIITLIIFVPAVLVAGSFGADRLGYCVTDTLFGQQGINAQPYVQRINSDSATIVWRTTTQREGTARIESAEGLDQSIELEASEIQIATFDDLEPDTTYTYEVELEERQFEGAFTTPPGPEGSVSIGVIGDSGTGSRAQFDIAGQLLIQDLDAVLHTGDVVYRRGALCHYGPKFFLPYEELIATTPMYPSLGNHDLEDRGGEAYFDTFVLPEADPEYGEAFYSFDTGPVHVSVLNSEFYAEEDELAIVAQREWLVDDLQSSDRTWNIVVLHRPLYSSTGSKESEDIQEDLAPIFESDGVDLVLAGHAHNYERFEPIGGVTHIVTGGGGARLHGLDPSDETAAHAKTHHFVRIDASPDQLDITAIDRDGETFDAYSIER